MCNSTVQIRQIFLITIRMCWCIALYYPLTTLPTANTAITTQNPINIPQKNNATHEIQIKNTIKPSDLGYYKMFSWHYPKEFSITLNGKPLKSNTSIITKAPNLEVIVNYQWEYLGIKRTRKKRIVYATDPRYTNYTITFGSWETPEKIMIPHAKKLSVTDAP